MKRISRIIKNQLKDDDRATANPDFNENRLYGLVILPIIGIAVSTLILIAIKYQVRWVLRCIDCFERGCRQAQLNLEETETDSSTPPRTNGSSISTITNISPNHVYFWNDMFEYEPSIKSSSNDDLFVESAFQTSPLEISFAEQEHFCFESDEHDISLLDEDKIIYKNIKEPKLNEDIMNSSDITPRYKVNYKIRQSV